MLVGQVLDLRQAELLALVDVGGAGQGELEQRGRAGPAPAERQVGVAGPPGAFPVGVDEVVGLRRRTG